MVDKEHCQRAHIRDYSTKRAELLLALLVMISVGSLGQTSPSKRFSAQIPRNSVAEMLKLEELTGVDIETGQVTCPYTENAVAALIKAMSGSGDRYARQQALILLAYGMTQCSFSQDVLDNTIRPAVEAVTKANADREQHPVDIEAQRVLWLIRAAQLSDPGSRFQFLAATVPDRYGRSMDALEGLARLGTPQAEALLERIADRATSSYDEPTIEKADVELTKMTLSRQLSALNPQKNLQQLDSILLSLKNQNLSLVRKDDLRRWISTRVHTIALPLRTKSLDEIARDPSYSSELRDMIKDTVARREGRGARAHM
jgi:hypothetical protein